MCFHGVPQQNVTKRFTKGPYIKYNHNFLAFFWPPSLHIALRQYIMTALPRLFFTPSPSPLRSYLKYTFLWRRCSESSQCPPNSFALIAQWHFNSRVALDQFVKWWFFCCCTTTYWYLILCISFFCCWTKCMMPK